MIKKYNTSKKEEIKRALCGEYDFWIKRYERSYKKESSNKYVDISIISIQGDDESIKSIKACKYPRIDLFIIKDGNEIKHVISQVKTEYIIIVDNSARLKKHALTEIVAAIHKNPDIDIFYCDEDSIRADGSRYNPIFKPDWSPDTLMSYDYIGSLCVIKTQIIENYYSFNIDNSMWKYDMLLQIITHTNNIHHIPKILCHTQKECDIDLSEKKSVLEQAMERRGWAGTVEMLTDINQTHIIYHSKGEPLVSIIIPSKDHPDELKCCIDSIVEHTNYKNYEIIVVDNGSIKENKAKYQFIIEDVGGTYIYEPSDFNFSHMCNIGEKSARGEYILFLNDDTEVISEYWIDRMLGHASLPHAGVVGAKLYFTNSKTIQHMGIILQATGPNHLSIRHEDEGDLYNYRNRLEYNWSAVTAACAMVSREKFREVNGFNEDFPVAYNDVDFCLKIAEKGYFNVVREDVILYHHESLSRGNDFLDEDKLRRLLMDEAKLMRLHPVSIKEKYYSSFYSKDGAYEGYDLLGNIEFKISNKPYKKSTKKHVCHIDTVDFTGGIASIKGWGMKFRDMCKIDRDIKLLYKGNNNYICDTVKFYREDLREVFPKEKDVEFCGFYTIGPANKIPVGEYKISIIYNNVEIETDKIIEVMI